MYDRSRVTVDFTELKSTLWRFPFYHIRYYITFHRLGILRKSEWLRNKLGCWMWAVVRQTNHLLRTPCPGVQQESPLDQSKCLYGVLSIVTLTVSSLFINFKVGDDEILLFSHWIVHREQRWFLRFNIERLQQTNVILPLCNPFSIFRNLTLRVYRRSLFDGTPDYLLY